MYRFGLGVLATGLFGSLRNMAARQKLKMDNIEKYIPEQIKEKVMKKKKKGVAGKLLALGIGIAGVIAGVGAAKLIKNKITKKAVILVGSDTPQIGHCAFNGYLVKYTDLDGLDAMAEALAEDEFTELIIVPMTVINGYEAEKIRNIMTYKKDLFESVKFVPALLSSDSDYTYVANVLKACTENVDEDSAVIYLAKGTTHFSNSAYIALSERLKRLDVRNVFIATDSSYPGLDKVMEEIEDGHFQNIIICPFEIYIDDEIRNAMSEENEDSWYNILTDAGYTCGCYYKGLCAYRGIRRLIVEHTKSVM